VALPALPLTVHGKLDRKALPAPDAPDAQLDTHVAPRTPEEIVLARIWCEVIGLPRAGVHDNFFEAGGDSLLSIQLVSRARQAGLALTPRHLLEHPTIAGLAAIAGSGVMPAEPRAPAPEVTSPAQRPTRGNPAVSLVALKASGSRAPLFCVHPGNGLAFCYRELAAAVDFDQPVYGLQARGLEPGEPIADSIEEMAGDYLEAIRRLDPVGPYHLCGYSLGGVIAFEMACQLTAAGGELASLTLIDSMVPTGIADPDQDIYDRIAAMARVQQIAVSADELRALGKDGAVARLGQLTDQSGLFAQLRPEHLRRMVDVYESFGHALRRYWPRPYAGPLALLRATQSSGKPVLRSRTLGWGAFVEQIDVIDIPGKHDDLLDPPASREVIAAMRALTTKRSR
jgi:thioesterase domain-containing protein/aryl carrier-like protein